jgi:hypothetical protein
MSTSKKSSPKFALSLDLWAVVLSFALAVLIRVGVIRTIPW